jgi:hypothetical protein
LTEFGYQSRHLEDLTDVFNKRFALTHVSVDALQLVVVRKQYVEELAHV